MKARLGSLMVLMASLLACHSRPATPAGGLRVEADTLRATVERIGSEPLAHWIARTADGSACVVTMRSGAPLAVLAGLEVTLWGTRTTTTAATAPGVTCAFDVAAFAVRAVNGIPAADGILRAVGSGFALELASGERKTLASVPAVLRAQVGARIYWAGPLDRAPEAYGVLEPAP
ncbi:MAG: hypothetical protein ACYC7F_09500 [Gemmatimonadaceae bacterium]